MGTPANVVWGSGTAYIAPTSTALPTLTSYPIVWPVGWEALGYTEDGIEINYNPTYKPIEVDEELAEIDLILAKEQAEITIKLAEATLENLNRAVSASTLTTITAGGNDRVRFNVGSGSPTEFMFGFEAPAPGDALTRVCLAYRVKSIASVGMKIQRTDKVVIPLQLRVLADSTKSAGERLFKIEDISADSAS